MFFRVALATLFLSQILLYVTALGALYVTALGTWADGLQGSGASIFNGVISRSCDGPDGRGASKGSLGMFLSFRQYTVVGHGITPSYAR